MGEFKYYYKIKEGRKTSNGYTLSNIILVGSRSKVTSGCRGNSVVRVVEGFSTTVWSPNHKILGEFTVGSDCLEETTLFNPSEGFTFFTHQKS